ncbi:MAG TPA: DUF192 domain-containing protein [Thermoanaerobaculia bacterium]|nr:DUF192 domain-containing protein [Thermoanaerobaculia bacterium]
MTPHVRVANTFWLRFRGLIGETDPERLSLLIPRCSAVHTFFMRVPIDIHFLDAEENELKVVHGAKPWRFYFGPPGTVSVLELPPRNS